MCGADQDHGAHEVGVIDGGHFGDEVSEGVSGQDGGSIIFVLNHSGDVMREIVQGQIPHWPGAAAITAGLRAQDSEAGCGDALGDRVEFVGVASEGWQEDDRRAGAFGDYLNGNAVLVNYFVSALLDGERE